MTRLVAALVCVGVLGSAGVHAHTRPAALTAAHQRADGDLVLGATWGLAYRDAGEWSLGCAAAFGVDANVEDAQLTLDGSGAIVLGTFGGLYESVDGCTLTQPEGPLRDGWVVDVVTDAAGGVWAALTQVAGEDQLYRRSVDGSWTPVGEPVDSLIGQLHVSGDELWRVTFVPLTATTERQVFLERSTDGVTFDSWELPIEGTEYSATILASREGEVHITLRHFDGETAPERLMRFDVAEESFTTVHRAAQLEAGAWTADGLWVLGRLGGLSLSPDGHTFAPTHDVAGRCLGVIDGVLATCLDPQRDGALLAHVTPSAVTPIARLEDFDSLRECPTSSDAAVVCPAFREALAEDVQVPVDGVPPPGASSSGGCATALPTRERAPLTEGAFALLLLFVQRRRRRTNASAAPMSAKP